MRQLLSDVVVVELAEGVAGDFCGKVFADLGADVVKVERPGGDPLRQHLGAFVHFNTNKRGIVADPSSDRGRDRLWRLLERADLVVEAPGQGGLADWSTSWEEVHARFPSLVVVSISGFGATGPYASYKWTDLVAQAFSGALLLQGDADQPPLKLPMSAELCAAGHTAALGALAAVMRSKASGAGAFVDCAATEALASPPGRIGRYLGYEYGGRQPGPQAVATNALTLIPIGVFPCGDGYVAMMSTPQQLPEMLDVLDDDALRAAFARPDAFVNPDTKEILDAALYPWLLSHTRAQITSAAQAAGWPLAGVNAPDEVLSANHLHQRGFWVHVDDPAVGSIDLPGAPYRYAEGGWRIRRSAPTLGRDDAEVDRELAAEPAARPSFAAPKSADAPPLQGIRVLDLTTVWSGPFLTLLLADLGAEVIRVESPLVFPPTTKGYLPRPDDRMMLGSLLTAYGPLAPGREDRPYNRHAMNNSVSRGKLSCTLDVRDPESRELFMRLVDESDVFIENLKSSTLHQMGIHETQLLERNPRMIVMRLPPAGLAGDWSNYTGFGAQFDGLTGLAWLCGHHDTDLTQTPPTMHMDGVTGPAGAFAILAALHYRDATGRGQLVELAQSENVLQQLGDVFVDCQLGIEPQRMGNRHRDFAPQGMYRCTDDHWLAISVTNDTEWSALASVIGRPELSADPRFATAVGRRAEHDELDRIIGEWTSGQDAYDAFYALQQAGIPAAPLVDDPMMATDPHIAAREWLRPLPSLDVGTFRHIGQAYRGFPQVWERGSPTLGQDNEYVYKKVIGVDDDEYERLVATRIATEDYLDRDRNPV